MQSSARLSEIADQIIDGIERAGPGYVVASAARVADAWTRDHALDRPTLDTALTDAATTATTRVVIELRTLLATSAEAQRATPLEIVRGIVAEPTAVLAAAGIPPVVRDGVQERLRPDDPYDLVPTSLGDLNEALGPLQLAWGLAKTSAIRANRTGSGD